MKLPLLAFSLFLLLTANAQLKFKEANAFNISFKKSLSWSDEIKKSGVSYTGIAYRKQKDVIVLVAEYVDGFMEGEVNVFYEDGTIRGVGKMKAGQLNGRMIYWRQNGDVMQDGSYVDGKKDGKWKLYYSQNEGYVFREYNHGYKDGKFLHRSYEDDTLFFGEYHLDHKIGEWLEWDHKTKTRKVVDYGGIKDKLASLPDTVGWKRLKEIDGLLYYENVLYTGVRKSFHSNGATNQRQRIVDGKIRSWEGYFISGKPWLKTSYRGAEKHGDWFYFHQNGTIARSMTYKDDLLDGEYREYSQEGDLRRLSHYEKGELHGMETVWRYDDPSIKENERTYLSGKLNGLTINYYKDGTPYQKINYRDGEFDGPHEHFYTDGKLNYRLTFKMGVQTEFTSFHPNGAIKEFCKTPNGRKNGAFYEYYPDGEIKREGNYSKGRRIGTWKTFYREIPGMQEVEYYENDVLLKSELVLENGQSIFEYDPYSELGFQQFLRDIKTAVESRDTNELSQLFHSEVYTGLPGVKNSGTEKFSYKDFIDRYRKAGMHYLWSDLSVAYDTGIKEWGPALEAPFEQELIFTNFAIKQGEIEESWKKGRWFIPRDEVFGIYAQPDPNSNPIENVTSWCGQVDLGCTNDLNSYDGCWHDIPYNGGIAYINHYEIVNYWTRTIVLFAQVEGVWKIIAVL